MAPKMLHDGYGVPQVIMVRRLVKAGGEGSRGGHVIGHRANGSPIYAPIIGKNGEPRIHPSDKTKGWSEDDRREAIRQHLIACDGHHEAMMDARRSGNEEARKYHWSMREGHYYAANHHHLSLHGKRALGRRPSPTNPAGDMKKAATIRPMRLMHKGAIMAADTQTQALSALSLNNTIEDVTTDARSGGRVILGSFKIGTFLFSFRRSDRVPGVLTVQGGNLQLPYHMICKTWEQAQSKGPGIAKTFLEGKVPEEGVFRLV